MGEIRYRKSVERSKFQQLQATIGTHGTVEGKLDAFIQSQRAAVQGTICRHPPPRPTPKDVPRRRILNAPTSRRDAAA